MSFNVNQFRAQLQGDGARPNLFQVNFGVLPNFAQTVNQTGLGQLVNPNPLGNNSLLSFMAKSAQIPGASIGTVPVYYFGREMKFAGNRTFADWTITVINDENFQIRSAMENWMNAINSHVGNIRNPGAISPTGTSGISGGSSYVADATVQQFSKLGTTIPQGLYTFVGMFPTDISPIDLSWDANDAIEEFTVTFAYQYWTNGNSVTTSKPEVVSAGSAFN